MPIVKLPNGQLRDEIRLTLYDTVDIDAAEAPEGNRLFFTDIQGKSLAETNLVQPGMLQTAVSYRIQGMALDCANVYAGNRQALSLITQCSSLRLHIGEKDYWAGPMLFATGRLKQNAAAAATTQTAPGAAVVDSYLLQHFGDEAIQGIMFPGDHYVDINPLQNFFVEWICSGMSAAEEAAATPVANTRLRFLLSLKGLQRRPVQ